MSLPSGEFAKYAERAMKKEAVGGGAETAATIGEFTRTLPFGNFMQDLPSRTTVAGGIPGYLAGLALVDPKSRGAAFKRDMLAVPGAVLGDSAGRAMRALYRRMFRL